MTLAAKRLFFALVCVMTLSASVLAQAPAGGGFDFPDEEQDQPTWSDDVRAQAALAHRHRQDAGRGVVAGEVEVNVFVEVLITRNAMRTIRQDQAKAIDECPTRRSSPD